MFEYIRNTILAFINSLTVRKIPLYLVVALFLYTIASTLAIANSLILPVSFVLAPVVVALSQALGSRFITFVRGIQQRVVEYRLINRPIYVLLREVGQGNYHAFRAYLIHRDIRNFQDSRFNSQNFDLTRLGQAFQGTPVNSLSLIGHSMGNIRAASLGNGLQGTQINTLILRSNHISNPERLVNALRNTQVTTLDLSENSIDDEGVSSLGVVLRGTPITSLNLTHNNIGIEGAVRLIEGLRGSQVRELHLSQNHIGNGDVARIANALIGTQITTLYLNQNNIDANGIAAIVAGLQATQITKINFDGNNLADAGAATRLGNALQNNSKITDLSLNQCNITDNGCASLGETLQLNKTLTTLSMANNVIGIAGAISLIRGLRGTRVNSLDLYGSHISIPEVARLADHLQETSLVELRGFNHPEITEALKINRREIAQGQLSAYYIARLQHLPQETKAENFNLPALQANATTQDQLKFAGGIFTQLGVNADLSPLQNKILSFLPRMNPKLAQTQQTAVANRAARGQGASIAVSDENNTNNSLRRPG